jgi:hypothetical protein
LISRFGLFSQIFQGEYIPFPVSATSVLDVSLLNASLPFRVMRFKVFASAGYLIISFSFYMVERTDLEPFIFISYPIAVEALLFFVTTTPRSVN